MNVEVHCSECGCQSLVSTLEQTWERIVSEGPWHSLGDGETSEDRIAQLAHLAHGGPCPRCGAHVVVPEESLCRLSLALLANW